jgi:hypothetical protein
MVDGYTKITFKQEIAVETTNLKGKKPSIGLLSPRNMKACYSIGTALIESIPMIGTKVPA